jgi:hypothetical protein
MKIVSVAAPGMWLAVALSRFELGDIIPHHNISGVQ